MKRDFRFRDSYTYENHLQYDPKELVFLFLSVLGFSITCRCYRILSNLQSMSHYFVCSKLSETRSNFLRWHDSFSNHKTQQAKNAGACFKDLQLIQALMLKLYFCLSVTRFEISSEFWKFRNLSKLSW